MTAIEMRRFLLGEESRFVNSVVGRITILVLFTTLVGVGFTLLFLVSRLSPFLLKFAAVIGVGLSASFMTRRLLPDRTATLRLFAAAFAALIALGVLSLLTLGFVGLNLVRQYPIATPLDAAIQLIVVGLAVWAGQRAWTRRNREVMVEPRYEPAEVTLRPSRPPRPVSRPSRSTQSFARRISRTWNSAVSSVSGLLTPPARGKRRVARPAGRSRRSAGITLSADEQHVCPYCLEPVQKRDPRGIKICKVCKTWHHADCWSITGVCQVPHEYQSQ
jgi:ribosomal protein L37AE/L43A